MAISENIKKLQEDVYQEYDKRILSGARECGTFSITSLSRKTGISRKTIYKHLKNLLLRKKVRLIEKRKYQYIPSPTVALKEFKDLMRDLTESTEVTTTRIGINPMADIHYAGSRYASEGVLNDDVISSLLASIVSSFSDFIIWTSKRSWPSKKSVNSKHIKKAHIEGKREISDELFDKLWQDFIDHNRYFIFCYVIDSLKIKDKLMKLKREAKKEFCKVLDVDKHTGLNIELANIWKARELLSASKNINIKVIAKNCDLPERTVRQWVPLKK